MITLDLLKKLSVLFIQGFVLFLGETKCDFLVKEKGWNSNTHRWAILYKLLCKVTCILLKRQKMYTNHENCTLTAPPSPMGNRE